MCGIIGHIHQKEQIDPSLFNRMRDTMIHRGPDGAGTKLLNNGRVALGHRRLSIIDLSESGSQPMTNEDSSIWLTFNGEIYNFQGLRQSLYNSGHIFHSKTDSEVLIHGYEEWGIEGLLSRIKGMFSLGIWDEKKQKFWACRDRFGIKPFYYYLDKEQLIFASEIKGIVENKNIQKEIDTQSLADFFIYSYVPNPRTIWKDIHKLPPAHFLAYDFKDHSLAIEQYWDIPVKDRNISEHEALKHTHSLIHHSVEEHLVSDVPVGIFLSGGYDSTTVLMHMSQLRKNISSFSIGFEDSERSEHVQAAKIAQIFQSQHNEEVLTAKLDSFAIMEELAFHFDEPFAISSMIPYFLVSKFAAKHNKVAMVGDGGDEAFAGYNWHYHIDRYFQSSPKRKLASFVPSWKRKLMVNEYNNWMTGVLYDPCLPKVLSEDIHSRIKERGLWQFEKYYRADIHPIKSFQFLDFNTFIPEPCLTRADRSSMANSLEVRVPFLDHEIFEFTFGLTPEVYFKTGTKKYLIRKNLENKVDESILNMPKRGFSFQHMSSLFGSEFIHLMESGHLVSHQILRKNIDYNTLGNRLKFHLLVLEWWFRKYN